MVGFGAALKTYPLRSSMELYWDKITLPLINKRRNSHLTIDDVAWQIDDWEWTWDKEHASHCRSRGGSKTFDYTHYVSFRAIRTGEKWAWLTPKGGQLSQATMYFQENPLYKGIVVQSIGNVRKHFIELLDASKILIGIVSTSNLGMRLDGVVIDEEEDMEPKQTTDVYPQMEGMMTDSQTGQFIHLGTLWSGSKFNEHVEAYPSTIIPWDKIPHLLASPKMNKIIANKTIAEWEKDLLYRCIPTAPNGVMFADIQKTIPEQYDVEPTHRGWDFGGIDHEIGVYLPNNRTIVILEEREFDLERYPDAVFTVRGGNHEAEGGGYNENDRYGNKEAIVTSRLGCVSMRVTFQWKAERQKKARECTIYCDPNRTPNMYRELKSMIFGPDGLYLKNNTDHPCHWFDAFLHAIGAGGFVVWNTAKGKISYSVM